LQSFRKNFSHNKFQGLVKIGLICAVSFGF
jgi:hypothetical protein